MTSHRSQESLNTTPEIQLQITNKLKEIFGDDDVSVLTDYICHMLSHNQPREHIINELKEFLSDEATQFGTWVCDFVESESIKNVENSDNISIKEKKSNEGNSLDDAISSVIKDKTMSGRSMAIIGAQRNRNYKNLPTNTFGNKFPKVYNYRSAPYTGTIGNQNGLVGRFLHPYNQVSNTNNQTGGLTNSGNSIQTGGSIQSNKIKIRCKNWPNCESGDHCLYIHPNEACKLWPHCPYGPGCFYIHPGVPCRYGLSCYNTLCNYSHPNGWDPNHIEAPVFKYGGYKNTTLIINNNKRLNNDGNRNNEDNNKVITNGDDINNVNNISKKSVINSSLALVTDTSSNIQCNSTDIMNTDVNK
ncbi:uncharacterized protein CMU_042860 [Cryptosporidium muris RN66]|uniref:C3H1-type domain-containing protein n=1 Tax=Cryptosporidium muris (strain RN66) TaxID=441375 RepID=B6AAH1_CRYMR|nr:uncharacterized protein CMU_042860 [Cryptosporidium muris RN66]EEA05212.1 hypothetical protein, conserved [Cryptosporidium muris RN66]|eukprot:XP_002139561.1 hypothetical protein [Cryptosporidium muris RN66]